MHGDAASRHLPLSVVLWSLTLALACGGPQIQATAPAGFATYQESTYFRAVSSDGVVFRARVEANEPKASLEFWREALKKRMQDAGYVVVAAREVEAGGNKGHMLELAAPLGVEDYSYAVAFFVQDRTLLIVEAAGEVTRYTKHKDSILQAISTVRYAQ